MGYPITDEQIIPIIRLIKSAHGKDREDLLAAAIEVLMYLVYSRAKHYKSQPFYDDLLQEGKVALILAISKFDESRGNKFFWFADWYLKIRFKSTEIDKKKVPLKGTFFIFLKIVEHVEQISIRIFFVHELVHPF